MRNLKLLHFPNYFRFRKTEQFSHSASTKNDDETFDRFDAISRLQRF